MCLRGCLLRSSCVCVVVCVFALAFCFVFGRLAWLLLSVLVCWCAVPLLVFARVVAVCLAACLCVCFFVCACVYVWVCLLAWSCIWLLCLTVVVVVVCARVCL